ncbi:hypothetical protein ACA910_011018 [Epithemia clementina (nom. ined.)]
MSERRSKLPEDYDDDDDQRRNNKRRHDPSVQPTKEVEDENIMQDDEMMSSSQETQGQFNDNNNNNSNHNQNAGEAQKNVFVVDLEAMTYAFESFRTISMPVSSAMILAALASNWITTEEWSESMEESLSNSYNVVEVDEEAGNSAMLGSALINGLVIVAVICAITFLVVGLLKFRCMKLLYGYLIFTFVTLLFFVASEFFRVAIEAYSLDRVDKITYWLSLFNFALVGTLSIFLPHGVPMWLTQTYLVLASVLVAWQLSQFNLWTAWVLLVLLSLYDLFAVLTPCGPLKALIDLMQTDDAPEMPPGLLFEARNRPTTNVSASSRQSRRAPATTTGASMNATVAASAATTTSNDATTRTTRTTTPTSILPGSSKHPDDTPLTQSERIASVDETPDFDRNCRLKNGQNQTTLNDEGNLPRGFEDEKVELDNLQNLVGSITADSNGSHEITLQDHFRGPYNEEDSKPDIESPSASTAANQLEDEHDGRETSEQANLAGDSESPSKSALGEDEPDQSTLRRDTLYRNGRVVVIPLALARLYKLPLQDDPNPSWRLSRKKQHDQEQSSTAREFSVEQLLSMVNAVVPRQGGLIEPHPKQRPDKETRYKVTDCHGELRRIVFVGKEDGGVFEDRRHEEKCDAAASGNGVGDDDHEGAAKENDRIRLGLGDFVFYSVLVALASNYSFSSFAACFIVILNGLMVTLLVLAVLKRALPALPISILAAIVAYVLTRVFLQDWIEEVNQQGTYV